MLDHDVRQRPAPGIVKGTTAKAVRSHRKRRNAWLGLAYASPALLAYGYVVIVPLLQSLNYSFYSWNGVTTARWVGMANYVTFFTDPALAQAFGHVLVLIGFFAILPIVFGLISAGLLGRGRIKGQGIYRWLLFLPQVLTSVVVAVIWKRLYGPDGPINDALRAVGLGPLAVNWLGDFNWALPALGLIGTWTTLGFCMVLFVAGVVSIPSELYEQARIDGAGPVAEFFAVTLPGLRGQLAIAVTLTVTGALRSFDLVWIITSGGPGDSTTTPALLLYQKAFLNPDVGEAAAIGIVLALICLVIALGVNKLAERND